MRSERKSVFRRGADDGFYFGIYLTALFFLWAYSMRVPFFAELNFVMGMCVPVRTYRFLRRYYGSERGLLRVSALWMHGIVIFFCGSLILALVSYVFFRWIQPGFILNQVEYAVEVCSAASWARGQEMADLAQAVIDNDMLPKPNWISMEIVFTGTFSGSMLSVLMALLVMARPVKTGFGTDDGLNQTNKNQL